RCPACGQTYYEGRMRITGSAPDDMFNVCRDCFEGRANELARGFERNAVIAAESRKLEADLRSAMSKAMWQVYKDRYPDAADFEYHAFGDVLRRNSPMNGGAVKKALAYAK